MRSLPVGATIARAWGFAGRRILPLLGVSWLAAVFYGLVVSYFLARLSEAMLVWPRPDAGSFNNFALFYLFCLVVVTAFANAAMALPMTREALEPDAEWKSAYFVIARREWALFANLLLLYVIVIGVVSAIAFAGSVGIAVSLPMIGPGGVWQGIPLAPVMTGLLTFIAVATGLFLATRFGFFLAPIAVAEPPARLLQAWSLSSGNFWRILAIGLALFVPIVVLTLAIDWVLFGSQFGNAIAALFAPPHDKTALFHMIQDHAGMVATVWAGALLVLNAIFAGASADAHGQVEHEAAPSCEHVAMAEPAFAAAAASPHLAVTEMRRVEPEFAPAEPPKPLAKAPEEETPAPLQAVEAMSPVEPVAAEFVAEPVTPAPVAAHSADPDAISSIAPPEEPLAAHQDIIPAFDPLGHAAPAAPDPAGDPATPLPSFVKAQPSPKSGSSEAA